MLVSDSFITSAPLRDKTPFFHIKTAIYTVGVEFAVAVGYIG